MGQAATYKEHLFDNTTDGYIQCIKLEENKTLKIYNTRSSNIKEVIESVEGEKDTFITPNTMYKPYRRVENIRQFRAFFIDIDNVEGDQGYIAYKIFEMAERKEIPMPSMIISSGRGLHIYWRIKNAPYGALSTWQELEDMLYFKLKSLGADKKATDGARVLRLPGTLNTKNNEMCNILYINNDIEYSMYDLREQYLNIKPKQLKIQQTKKKSDKVIVNAFFNSYSLHMSRVEDILTLCELRKYNLKGYRNMILHCYAYWKGIYIRDFEELTNEVIELNNSFREPLKETEVKAILRCIPKAIDRFIAYEQGVRAGERKRVTKGMKDKEGYWYKNETLIERLGITEEEERKLKTIIGKRVKYDRNNEKRTPRNKEGLTPREQQKRDRLKQVIELKNQGLKQIEIAEKLSISRQAVSKLFKQIV